MAERGRKQGSKNSPKSMTDHRLRDVIRAECNQFYKYGRRARSSDVVAIIKSDHPDLIREYVGTLADRELQRMCVDAMKSWQSVSGLDKTVDDAKQVVLPGLERHMASKLPPAISMPIGGDKNDIEFVPATVALPEEWRKHLAYLKDHHGAVGLVIAAISELLERGDGCPENVSLVKFVVSKQSELV